MESLVVTLALFWDYRISLLIFLRSVFSEFLKLKLIVYLKYSSILKAHLPVPLMTKQFYLPIAYLVWGT